MSTLNNNCIYCTRYIKIHKKLQIPTNLIIILFALQFVLTSCLNASPILHETGMTAVAPGHDISNSFSLSDQRLLPKYLAEEKAHPTITSNIVAAITIYDKYRKAYLIKKYSLKPSSDDYLAKVSQLELAQYLLMIHTKLTTNQNLEAYARICMLSAYVLNQNLLNKYSAIIKNKYTIISSYKYIITHIHQHPLVKSNSIVSAYYLSQESLGIYDVRKHLNDLAIKQLERTSMIISHNKISYIPDMQLVWYFNHGQISKTAVLNFLRTCMINSNSESAQRQIIKWITMVFQKGNLNINNYIE